MLECSSFALAVHRLFLPLQGGGKLSLAMAHQMAAAREAGGCVTFFLATQICCHSPDQSLGVSFIACGLNAQMYTFPWVLFTCVYGSIMADYRGELGDDALGTSEGVMLLKAKYEGLQRKVEELVSRTLIVRPH